MMQQNYLEAWTEVFAACLCLGRCGGELPADMQACGIALLSFTLFPLPFAVFNGPLLSKLAFARHAPACLSSIRFQCVAPLFPAHQSGASTPDAPTPFFIAPQWSIYLLVPFLGPNLSRCALCAGHKNRLFVIRVLKILSLAGATHASGDFA